MKAIVVEDEKNVREGFIKLLAAFRPDVEVVAVADSVEKGIQVIQSSPFDILFLDINLPDGSGFDLLHRLSERNFHLIFVTAYDKYAIEAFKLSAIDYLMKPVNPELLIKAIKKVDALVGPTLDDRIDIAESLIADKSAENKVILSDQESIHIVKIEEIIFCRAEGSYTMFQLTNGRSILTSQNLKEYESLLGGYRFIRPHHSFLINMNHILELKKIDGGLLVMTDRTQIPISSRKKASIMEQIKKVFIG